MSDFSRLFNCKATR